jgi:hypothetical protein
MSHPFGDAGRHLLPHQRTRILSPFARDILDTIGLGLLVLTVFAVLFFCLPNGLAFLRDKTISVRAGDVTVPLNPFHHR